MELHSEEKKKQRDDDAVYVDVNSSKKPRR